ncbi:MAG: T9SS type A sorting domain-containing protein, partial [Bacteroidota bacterium]
STSNDLLRVFTSTNCGENWTNKYNKSGSALSTAGVVANNFNPSATQWRLETVSLNGVFPRTNIRFKFQNTSDRGNNTYVDELQITGTPSNVDEVDEVTSGFGLFPNPTTADATVQFKLNSTQRVRVYVHDITGRMISQVLDETLNADLHDVKISINTPGIYLVDVLVGEKHHVRRLTVSQ